MEEEVQRFMRLFIGNDRSHGVYHPQNERMETIKSSADASDYINHLEGSCGLGIVPIMDDGNCWFGAIDIDAHGDEPDIDLSQVESRVRDNDLPLVLCRSKSGGAHLYLFLTDPTPATLVRKALKNWAGLIGHAGVEIFPKQDSLPASNGERQLGNWLNLCNFQSKDTIRYGWEGGQKLSLGHFLDIADSRRVKAATLVEKAAGEYGEAPPCIQKMLTDGVGRGHRNEALYNITLYYKKSNPETWRDKAMDANARVFTDPLPYSEAKKTIASAGRRDYKYKCKEEPCRSSCNSSVCVKRKYGITPAEKSELEVGSLPDFGRLEKYNTDPVKWVLHVDQVPIVLSTLELMDYRSIRRAVADNLTRVIPTMKNDQWEGMLNAIMGEARVIEAPEEASTYGFIKSRLFEFFRKTDLASPGDRIGDRDSLELGVPVVQLKDDVRVVYFRGGDFIDYLKKNRSEELKGSNLWVALKKVGVQHDKLRVRDRVIAVWYVPLSEDNVIKLQPKKMESEI